MKDVKRLPSYLFLAFLVYMPFHIFVSQSVSELTGGLSVWKAAKDVLLLFVVAGSLLLAWNLYKKHRDLRLLTLLGAAYGAVHLAVWGLNSAIYKDTAIQGVIYNNRPVLFLLLGLAAVLVSGKVLHEPRLVKITLIVSTIVCVLGIVQYVLPKDILTHVGYSVERGVKPAFFIDDKPDFPRIMSTLRDPNSLGAFLLVPLSLLYGLFVRALRDPLQRKRRWQLLGLTGLHVTALFLTFSRGAWLGAFLTLVACVIWATPKGTLRFGKKTLYGGLAAVVLLAGLAFVFRDQTAVQNILQHSDETTVAPQDSNALHLDFAADGMRAGFAKPLGHGPGTAGIVSIRNPRGGQLTENYYIQLLYEVGVVGAVIFIATLVYVGRRLRASTSLLGTSLFCVLVAYAVISLLMHLWSNEAVAAQWWLLSGAAIGLALRGVSVSGRNTRRTAVHKQRIKLANR